MDNGSTRVPCLVFTDLPCQTSTGEIYNAYDATTQRAISYIVIKPNMETLRAQAYVNFHTIMGGACLRVCDATVSLTCAFRS
jgi:hypothetical protein